MLLAGYWEVLSRNTGLPARRIAEQALIAPARCCLKNTGRVGASDDSAAPEIGGAADLTVEERLVEKAFNYLGILSAILQDKFSLSG